MNMYPQMETPGGTCTPKQKYEWACWIINRNPGHVMEYGATKDPWSCWYLISGQFKLQAKIKKPAPLIKQMYLCDYTYVWTWR